MTDVVDYYRNELLDATRRRDANYEAVRLAHIAMTHPPGPVSGSEDLCPSLLRSLQKELAEAQSRVLACAFNYYMSSCLAAEGLFYAHPEAYVRLLGDSRAS